MQTPPVDILHHSPIMRSGDKSPLHSQVRQALRVAIDAYFDDGQQFWPETVLIETLGVSRITVRRALEDLAREGVIKRYQAKGSFVCKSGLVKQETKVVPHIGILAPNCGSAYLTALIEQIALASTQHKQLFSIHLSDSHQDINEMLCQLEHGADNEAVLLVGTRHTIAQKLYDTLRERSYRVVCVDTPARNAPYVGVDNKVGIRLGLEHLRDLGHRRVAYVLNEPPLHPVVAERVQAVETIGSELGMETRIFDPATPPGESMHRATLAILNDVMQWKPTAIFTASDTGAWLALKWLREQGISVPGEVSVLGFDDDAPSAHTFPTLSSVVIPTDLVAQGALELLNSPHLHTAFWPPRELVMPRLVERDSTGPAPREGI